MSPRRVLLNGPREKSRGYTRWPDDWLGSRMIRDMTFEEEGVYSRLMDVCWKYVGLPVDLADIEFLLEKTLPESCQWILDACFPITRKCPSKTLDADFRALGDARRFCAPGSLEVQRWKSRGGKTRAAQIRADQDSSQESTVESSQDSSGKGKGKGKGLSGKKRNTWPPWNQDDLPIELDVPVFHDEARNWIAHRREYRRPAWKPQTWKANLRRLAPLGAVGAAECLKISRKNIWAGIFPDGGGPKGRPRNALDQAIQEVVNDELAQ